MLQDTIASRINRISLLKFTPVVAIVAALYSDIISTIALHNLTETNKYMLALGLYFDSKSPASRIHIITILNFSLLIFITFIVLTKLCAYLFSKTKTEIVFQRYYIQHVMFLRVLYLVELRNTFSKDEITTDFFTDVACTLTALGNLVFGAITYTLLSNLPPNSSDIIPKAPSITLPNIPSLPSLGIRSIASSIPFLNENQGFISKGFFLPQIIFSAISFIACLTVLIRNFLRRYQEAKDLAALSA